MERRTRPQEGSGGLQERGKHEPNEAPDGRDILPALSGQRTCIQVESQSHLVLGYCSFCGDPFSCRSSRSCCSRRRLDSSLVSCSPSYGSTPNKESSSFGLSCRSSVPISQL